MPSANPGRVNAEGICSGHQQNLLQVDTQQCLPLSFCFKKKKKKLECILRNFPITEFQGKNQENSKRSCISKSCGPSRKFFATQVSTLGGMHMLIMG